MSLDKTSKYKEKIDLSYEDKIKLLKKIYNDRLCNTTVKFDQVNLKGPLSLEDNEYLLFLINILIEKVNYLDEYWEPYNLMEEMDSLTEENSYNISETADPIYLDICLHRLWLMYGEWENDPILKNITRRKW